MTGALRVEFEATAKISATVDIAAYYLGMTERERAAYLKWDDRGWWEGDPVSKPVAYLMADLDDAAEVNSGMGGLSPAVRDDSEIEDWDEPRVRAGGRWTEENYAVLLAAVPWLAEADRIDELPDEERAEIEARAPHDWDVPLFDMPATVAS